MPNKLNNSYLSFSRIEWNLYTLNLKVEQMGNTTEVIRMNGFKRNLNILLNSTPALTQSNYPAYVTTSQHSNPYAIISASTLPNSSTSLKQASHPLWSGTQITMG